MPPSGFSRRAVEGILDFVGGCYEDLLAEVRSGKHESYEAAIEHELGKIDSALAKLHITPDGELVEQEVSA
ncbi:MAG TPA: hypothetical protein VJC05_04400 [Candidatus Andersenbacteria bacterium]|nr:hypothetical protein [Candidatus Andersenbacteria bacterium]